MNRFLVSFSLLYLFCSIILAQPVTESYDNPWDANATPPYFSSPVPCVSSSAPPWFTCEWSGWDKDQNTSAFLLDPGEYFDGKASLGTLSNPFGMWFDETNGQVEFDVPAYSGLFNLAQSSRWRIMEIYGDGTYEVSSHPVSALNNSIFTGAIHAYPIFPKDQNDDVIPFLHGAYRVVTYIPPLKPPRGNMAVDVQLDPNNSQTLVVFPGPGQSSRDPFLAYPNPNQNVFFEAFVEPARGSFMVLCINYKDQPAGQPYDRISLVLDGEVFKVKGLLSFFGEELVNISNPNQSGVYGNLPYFSSPFRIDIELRKYPKKLVMKGFDENRDEVDYDPANRTVFLELAVREDIELEQTSIAAFGHNTTGKEDLFFEPGGINSFSQSFSLAESHDPNALILPLDSLQGNTPERGIPYSSNTSCRPLSYTVKFENDGEKFEDEIVIKIPIPEGWDKNKIILDSWYEPNSKAGIVMDTNYLLQGSNGLKRVCDTLVFRLDSLNLRGINEKDGPPLHACRGWVKFRTQTIELNPPTPNSLRTRAEISFLSVKEKLLTNISSPSFFQVVNPPWTLALGTSGISDDTYTNGCIIPIFTCPPVCRNWWCQFNWGVLVPMVLVLGFLVTIGVRNLRSRRSNTLDN